MLTIHQNIPEELAALDISVPVLDGPETELEPTGKDSSERLSLQREAQLQVERREVARLNQEKKESEESEGKRRKPELEGLVAASAPSSSSHPEKDDDDEEERTPTAPAFDPQGAGQVVVPSPDPGPTEEDMLDEISQVEPTEEDMLDETPKVGTVAVRWKPKSDASMLGPVLRSTLVAGGDSFGSRCSLEQSYNLRKNATGDAVQFDFLVSESLPTVHIECLDGGNLIGHCDVDLSQCSPALDLGCEELEENDCSDPRLSKDWTWPPSAMHAQGRNWFILKSREHRHTSTGKRGAPRATDNNAAQVRLRFDWVTENTLTDPENDNWREASRTASATHWRDPVFLQRILIRRYRGRDCPIFHCFFRLQHVDRKHGSVDHLCHRSDHGEAVCDGSGQAGRRVTDCAVRKVVPSRRASR
eukprot:COSAG02_NODE_2062_length_9971_cov_5.016106_5_plen_417_part_00